MRRPANLRRKATPVGVVVAIIVVAITLWQQSQSKPTTGTAPSTTPTASAPAPLPTPKSSSASRGKDTDRPGTPCADIIKSAIDDQRSDVTVECAGVIIKVLDDDNDGSRHQRFLVRLDNDAVIKLSHNIDLAPRVPAEKGDRVEFSGEFDWNDLGGAVHWTHHDPRGRRKGGWIRFDGQTYD
ncbi:MAG: DUF3465 domain-containing protein [Phycisphaerales bacterium]